MSLDLSSSGDGFSVELAKQKLAEIARTQSPLLAIDLDDVLCQTSERAAACEWTDDLLPGLIMIIYGREGHNEKFGTDMSTSSFYCE